MNEQVTRRGFLRKTGEFLAGAVAVAATSTVAGEPPVVTAATPLADHLAPARQAERAEPIHTPEPSLSEKIHVIEQVWNEHGFNALLDQAKASVEAFGMVETENDPLGNYWGVIN